MSVSLICSGVFRNKTHEVCLLDNCVNSVGVCVCLKLDQTNVNISSSADDENSKTTRITRRTKNNGKRREIWRGHDGKTLP